MAEHISLLGELILIEDFNFGMKFVERQGNRLKSLLSGMFCMSVSSLCSLPFAVEWRTEHPSLKENHSPKPYIAMKILLFPLKALSRS